MKAGRSGARQRAGIVATAAVSCLVTALGAVAVRHHEERARPPGRGLSAQHRATPSAGEPAPAAADPRVAAVQALLDVRAQAVLAHDPRRLLETTDPSAPASERSRETAQLANLRQVPLQSFGYELTPTTATALPPGRKAAYGGATTWTPDVVLHWSVAGYDQQPTADPLHVTFVQRDGRWYWASDADLAGSDDPSSAEPWDGGPVTVIRSGRCLVLLHPGSEVLARVVGGVVDTAVPVVDRAWGRPWTHRAVVVVPRDTAEMEALAQEKNLDQIAAVATTEIVAATGGRLRPSADRIIVNPAAFARLGPNGRRIVLTHELTHVATRTATGTGMPSWLVEGYADYVGYQGVAVPLATAAHELQVDLQRGRPLGGLPTEEDFASTSSRLPQAYEGAWLANRLVADRIGPRGLAALYADVGAEVSARQLDPGSPRAAAVVSEQLKAHLGLDLTHFVAAWHAYVVRELG